MQEDEDGGRDFTKWVGERMRDAALSSAREQLGVQLDRSWLPTPAIVSVIGSVAVAVWCVANQFNAFSHLLEQCRTDITRLEARLWTRADQRAMLREESHLNPGVKYPNPDEIADSIGQ